MDQRDHRDIVPGICGVPMKAIVISVRSFTLLIGILLVCVGIVAQQIFPDPPKPVSRVTVSICGLVPVKLITYDNGIMKAFFPPFPNMPAGKLKEVWELPIGASECQGPLMLEPITVHPEVKSEF